jgi:hypothetical protein
MRIPRDDRDRLLFDLSRIESVVSGLRRRSTKT